MANTDSDELTDLKERISCLSDNASTETDEVFAEARKCVLAKLEVLVASGLLESQDLNKISAKLEKKLERDVPQWRSDVVSSIELCLTKYEDYNRLRQATPDRYQK